MPLWKSSTIVTLNFVSPVACGTLATGHIPQWGKDLRELWRFDNATLTQTLTTARLVQEIVDEAQATTGEVMLP